MDFRYTVPVLATNGIFSRSTTRRLQKIESGLVLNRLIVPIEEITLRLKDNNHADTLNKIMHPLAQWASIKSGRNLTPCAGDTEILDLASALAGRVCCLTDAINMMSIELGVEARSGSASTKRVKGEPTFHYPTAHEILQSISELDRWECHSPILRAFNLYTMVIVLHPLTDGNGRLARTIFNLELQDFDSRIFIPLCTIGAFTRESMTLHMKEFLITGQDDGIARFAEGLFELITG